MLFINNISHFSKHLSTLIMISKVSSVLVFTCLLVISQAVVQEHYVLTLTDLSPRPTHDLWGEPIPDFTVPFTSCGNGSLTINDISSSLWPPVPGKDLALDMHGTSKTNITGGSYKGTVKFDGITLVNLSGKICDNMKCPSGVGATNFNYSRNLPAYIPSGKYNVELAGTDSQGKLLFCVQVDFTESSKVTLELKVY